MPADDKSDREILSAWLDEVERHWGAIGVRRAERRRLREELQSDLADALADGAPLASLIAETPSTFAEQVADASDVSYGSPPAASNGALVATALSVGRIGAKAFAKGLTKLAGGTPKGLAKRIFEMSAQLHWDALDIAVRNARK